MSTDFFGFSSWHIYGAAHLVTTTLCKYLTTLHKNPKYFLFDKNAHIDHSYISVRQIFKIKFIEEVFFFLTTLKLANYYNIWLRVTLIAFLKHVVTVDTAFCMFQEHWLHFCHIYLSFSAILRPFEMTWNIV